MAVVLALERARRRSFRRHCVFRDRRHPFEIFDDQQLVIKFRFDRRGILFITDLLKLDIEFPLTRGGATAPKIQVCIMLRYLAQNMFQDSVAETLGLARPTVSRHISRAVRALVVHAPRFIKKPTPPEANQQMGKFQQLRGFRRVFGAIVCTHVNIQAPTRNEDEYVNRKNKHSINVQAVCYADLMFMDCQARHPGSVHDSRILRESSLFQAMEAQPPALEGFILGDTGLLTPFLNPVSLPQQRYNDAHSATRQVVERSFGVLKRRWRCLKSELRVAPDSACRIIVACFILDNIATEFRLPVPPSDDDEDDTRSEDALPSQPTSQREPEQQLGKQ